jgi:hypothetical protein
MKSGCWRVWAIFVVGGAVLFPFSSRAQAPPNESPQRPPNPIEAPHKPAQEGFRLTATVGLSLLGNGSYRYNTTVTMPDGSALAYSGTQRSSGGTLSLGTAFTPGGALRRFTIGVDLNFGGLEAWAHPVIPTGSVTPFSQSNLNYQVARRSLTRTPWRPFVTPYLEHDVGSILGDRIRLGYEYMQTTGSLKGSFAADQSGSIQAGYNVKFSQASHMIRLSVHNDTWFDDADLDHVPTKRKFGFIQQAGMLIGTDASIVVFVNVGPLWTL